MQKEEISVILNSEDRKCVEKIKSKQSSASIQS